MVQAQRIRSILLAATFRRDRAKVITSVLLMTIGAAILFSTPMVAFAGCALRTEPQTVTTPDIRQLTLPAQTPSPNTKPTIGLQVGNIAPDFTLLNLSDKPVSLHDLRGKPVMLNFWYASCTDCQAEIPTMQQFYTSKQAVSQHFVILGVNTLGGDNKQTVQNYVQQNHLTYPIIMDDDQQRIATLYHVRETPTSYFLDPQGVIQSVLFGPIGKEKLQLVLADPKRAIGMTQNI